MENIDEVEGCLIFDCPKERGIELVFPIGAPGSNMSARIFMDDAGAQNFISIIQNKLNARL